jgi:hypothetical protein
MIDFSIDHLKGMIVGLKGNCSALLSYSESAFADQSENLALDTAITTDTRGVTREVSVMDTEAEKMGDKWQQVKQIICIKRYGIRYKSKKKSNKKSKKKKNTPPIQPSIPLPVPPTKTGKARSKNAIYFEQTSYYAVVKHKVQAADAAILIKGHWAIEGMHRAKDVQYNEDKNKIKCVSLSPNLSQIFNFTLNIFTLTGQKSITIATENLANRIDKLFCLISTTGEYLDIFKKNKN